MIQLTDADLDAAQQGQPVRLTDPAREGEFVLVSAAHFAQLKARVPRATEVEAGYALLAEVAPEDWEELSHYEETGGHASATR
jgi:hypothetical protein